MMPDDVQSQISELEAKLKHLRFCQVTELQEQLKTARRTVEDLHAEIAVLADHEVRPYLYRQFQSLSDVVCRCYFITMELKQVGQG